MYHAGIKTIDIMKITGHTLESNFLKYIKVTKEETADMLAAHPFFTGKGKLRIVKYKKKHHVYILISSISVMKK
ncbi:MAG: hypothetical protein AMS27_07620 [Bacteroides sp. SM23_62_1]|nr:MAG: hypothetical protein AMS27_07620 [Bacteroides sp. SM23_62_1]